MRGPTGRHPSARRTLRETHEVRPVANALGYLAGALLAAPLARRLGARRLFVAGMALTTVALLATAGTGNLTLLIVLRLLAGISGAAVFIAGAGLAVQLGSGARPGRAALLLGIYFAGVRGRHRRLRAGRPPAAGRGRRRGQLAVGLGAARWAGRTRPGRQHPRRTRVR